MKNNTVIFHFQPLELFPPAMNFITSVSNNKGFFGNLTVFSTKNNNNQFKYENGKIELKRLKGIEPHARKLSKLVRYFAIYARITLFLIKKKPNKVVYFETLSALPIILYYFLSSRKNKPSIYVHYHELVTIQELSKGRWLNQKINILEQKIYTLAKWISQTNLKRLEIFSEQYGLDKENEKLNTLPNYPPSSWLRAPKQMNEAETTDIIKLVHIGALSTDGMYLEHVLKHFGNNPKFTIDFYSHNFTPVITTLISGNNNCSIKGSIAYQDIPSLKGLYDVGLVLYRALTTNVMYCAPNKIFEYLALDLDVWCSDKLITAGEHERLECYPKMIMVDYENMEAFDVGKATDKSGLEYVPSPYVCEPVYEKLLNAINENTHP